MRFAPPSPSPATLATTLSAPTRSPCLVGSAGLQDESRAGTHVEAHVLRVALAHEQWDAPLGEVADGPRIVVERAGREALVRGVEEREQATLEEDRDDLLPLFAGRVDSGRVVRARVDEDDGLQGDVAKEREEVVEREADRFRVVVGVVDGRAADVGEDGLVVGWARRVQRAAANAGEADAPQLGLLT